MPELPFNQLLTRCRRRPRSAAGTARFFVCKTCKEIKMYPNQEEKKKSTLFIICSSQLQCNRPVSFRFARQMWHRDPAWAKTRTNHRECNSIIIFFRRKNNLVRMRRRLLGAGMLGSAMTSHPRSCFKFSSLLRSS